MLSFMMQKIPEKSLILLTLADPTSNLSTGVSFLRMYINIYIGRSKNLPFQSLSFFNKCNKNCINGDSFICVENSSQPDISNQAQKQNVIKFSASFMATFVAYQLSSSLTCCSTRTNKSCLFRSSMS